MASAAYSRGAWGMKRLISAGAAAMAIVLGGCAAISRDFYVEPLVVPVSVGGAQLSMRQWMDRYQELMAMPISEARQHYKARRRELETFECGVGGIEILMLLTRPDFATNGEFSANENLLKGCEDKPGWRDSDVGVLVPILLRQAELQARQSARERAAARELAELRRQIQDLKEVERSLQR